MRLLKILGITLASLLGLVLLTVATINLLPGEQYKRLVGSIVESATGRELVIGGDLEVDLGSSFRIRAADVRFSNPDWASRPDMFTGALVEGEVVLMPLLEGVLDVRLVLESPDLLLETGADGQANWQMVGDAVEQEADERVSPDGGGFPLRPFIREVRLEQVSVAFNDAAADLSHSAEFEIVLLRSREDDLLVNINGRLDEHPLTLAGGLVNTAPATVQTPAGFNLVGNLGEISLNASGTLDAISATADADLVVQVAVPSLAVFSAFAGRDLPDQGPLNASVRISGRDGRYSASDLKANLDAELLKAAVTGSVTDLSGLSGIDLSVDAHTARLSEVVALAGVEIPVELPPTLRAAAAISGSMETLAVSGFQVDVEDGSVKATATGDLKDAMALEGLTAAVTVEAGSVAAFSKYAKTELPDLGPVTASATVASSGETFSVSDIKAELSARGIQAAVEGSLADAIAVEGLDAGVKVNLDSLAVLNELTGQELPDSGPLSLTGTLVSEVGLDAPGKLTGTLSAEGVKARIDGTIQNLLAAQGIVLALDVEADSVAQAAALAGQEISHDEPLKLEGTLQFGSGSYKADKLNIQVGPNRITGEAAFKSPAKEGERPLLTADFHLGSIDLSRYFVLVDLDESPGPAGRAPGAEDVADSTEPGEAASEPAQTAGVASETDETSPAGAKSKKLFPSDPLPFDVLQQLDANVGITADELLTHNVAYYAVNARVHLEDGILAVDPFDASVGQGSFEARASLDASRKPARMSVHVDMDNGTTRYFGGTYSLYVDLDGSGNSIAEIMAGLDGQIIIDVRDLELEKSAMTQFGRSLTDSLNPFDKEEEKSELTCAIARLDIADGIANADDRIVAQMTRVTWFGGGNINLKTEQIGIGAQSKPRKGLGISLGGLASLVYVGGTLANPRIQLNPKDVAVKYGQHTLSVATAGVFTVLKGLWDRTKANSDVCAKVLELEEEDREKREAQDSDTASQAGPPDQGTEDASDVASPDAREAPAPRQAGEGVPAIHDLTR